MAHLNAVMDVETLWPWRWHSQVWCASNPDLLYIYFEYSTVTLEQVQI